MFLRVIHPQLEQGNIGPSIQTGKSIITTRGLGPFLDY